VRRLAEGEQGASGGGNLAYDGGRTPWYYNVPIPSWFNGGPLGGDSDGPAARAGLPQSGQGAMCLASHEALDTFSYQPHAFHGAHEC